MLDDFNCIKTRIKEGASFTCINILKNKNDKQRTKI